MNLVRRLLARSRIKSARRRLAMQPSPRHYVVLAQEYARLGMTRDVQRTSEEGLTIFPGSGELRRLCDRAKRLEREQRLVELKREIAEAPRPALWLELCEVLLESGRLGRAHECAEEWVGAFPEDSDGQLMVARIRLERFFADRGRELGQSALEALERCMLQNAQDARHWRLRLNFLSRIGAWKEARRAAAQLLKIEPGDPTLEARFRTLDSMTEGAPDVARALINVERTGAFADEGEGQEVQVASTDVRPLLDRLAEEVDVNASMYVRGQTAIVKGPRGATAERLARSIRSVIQNGRTTGRRLGLGQIQQIHMEGDFGAISIAPGELDAGALWTSGRLPAKHERALLSLAGINANVGEVQA